MFEKLIGIKLTRDMSEEDYFKSDIDKKIIKPNNINFQDQGIPVRHHDFNDYQNKIKPVFMNSTCHIVMELDLDEYFSNALVNRILLFTLQSFLEKVNY